MIEVTLKKATKKKVVIKYPCLMIGCLGSVVAFTDVGVGTLLKVSNGVGAKQLYKSSDDWIMSNFKIYKGSITLKNKC